MPHPDHARLGGAQKSRPGEAARNTVSDWLFNESGRQDLNLRHLAPKATGQFSGGLVFSSQRLSSSSVSEISPVT